ncbi:hypothetical protein EJ110_NYTH45281 [Nymphaea thermarum]|nr:hypothetical protein EJ110_NYTH45281 [Nymphaea thermarum]
MVAAGSTGQTTDQLLSFLRMQTKDVLNSFSAHMVPFILADGSRLGGLALSSASGVWVDELTPLKAFTDIMHGVHGVEAKTVNFWMKNKARVAEEQTQQHIRNLLRDAWRKLNGELLSAQQ